MSITELEEFMVIGIAVRTTNQNAQARTDIGELWAKFMTQNILEQIPNKASQEIYCIYTDYESDFLGAYTTILGCRVASLEIIPEGLVAKTIPATKYQVYTSTGRLPDAVGETWMNIWQADINRKYEADFDVYGEKAHNPTDAEVETFVSIA